MKHRKQKKPSKNQPPSSKRLWKEAKQAFHLNDEELAMAQAIEFTPVLMHEVAMGKCIKRSPHDLLPRHATPSQIKRVKSLIHKRYPAWVERNKGRLDEEARLIVPLPATLKARVEVQSAKEKVKLADEIRGFLETRFPAALAEGPRPVTTLTTEEASPPLAAAS
jgi:hypothetical protein